MWTFVHDFNFWKWAMLSRKGKAWERGYFGHLHGLITFLKAHVLYIYIYIYIYIKRLVAVGCIALTTLKLPWGIGSNILKESPLFFFCPSSSPPTPALILVQTGAFSSVSLFLRKILCLWVKRTRGPQFSFLPLVSQPPVILSELHWSDAAKEEIKKEVLCWCRIHKAWGKEVNLCIQDSLLINRWPWILHPQKIGSHYGRCRTITALDASL